MFVFSFSVINEVLLLKKKKKWMTQEVIFKLVFYALETVSSGMHISIEIAHNDFQ